MVQIEAIEDHLEVLEVEEGILSPQEDHLEIEIHILIEDLLDILEVIIEIPFPLEAHMVLLEVAEIRIPLEDEILIKVEV